MLSNALTTRISEFIKRPTTTFNHLGYISDRLAIDHNACISLYSSHAINHFKQASAYYQKKPEIAAQIVTNWRDRNVHILTLAYKHHTSPTFLVQLLLCALFNLDLNKDKSLIQAVMHHPPYIYLLSPLPIPSPPSHTSTTAPTFTLSPQPTPHTHDRLHAALQLALAFGDPLSLPVARLRNRVGVDYEAILHAYLRNTLPGTSFLTDTQLRAQHQTKTPDILFPIPLCVEQWFVRWMDSKMLFASGPVLDQMRKQLQGYGYRFDLGTCIFWSGVELVDQTPDTILAYTSRDLQIHDDEWETEQSALEHNQSQQGQNQDVGDGEANEMWDEQVDLLFSPAFLQSIAFVPTNSASTHSSTLLPAPHSINHAPSSAPTSSPPLMHPNQTCHLASLHAVTNDLAFNEHAHSTYHCPCPIGSTQLFHDHIDAQLFVEVPVSDSLYHHHQQSQHHQQLHSDSADERYHNLNDVDSLHTTNNSFLSHPPSPSPPATLAPQTTLALNFSTHHDDPFLASLLQFHLAAAHHFVQQVQSCE